MVGAVGERDADVNDGVAGPDALAHGVDDAALDGGDVFLGDAAADDLVDELEALAGVERLEGEDDVGVLAAAAGLLDELLVDLGRRRDGLAVGDLRRAALDFHAELALEAVEDDLEVAARPCPR